VNVVGEIRTAIERQGWSETARRSGISRVTLHRAFGDTRRKAAVNAGPSLATIERVLPSIGLELAVREVVR
jgi:DNA-binding phage protein